MTGPGPITETPNKLGYGCNGSIDRNQNPIQNKTKQNKKQIYLNYDIKL